MAGVADLLHPVNLLTACLAAVLFFTCSCSNRYFFLAESMKINSRINLLGISKGYPTEESGTNIITREVNDGLNSIGKDSQASYVNTAPQKMRPKVSEIRSHEEDRFEKRLPNTLIIGVKKGGTKALLLFLNFHPQIRACRKEVHFFDNQLHYRNGLSWYKNKMPRSYQNQITMEKSPRYFVTSRVPMRVYRMSPKMKIILILRDPVKRAISDYVHMKTRKKHALIKGDIETILWRNKTEFNYKARFIQGGLYSVFLKRWLLYFPRDQIHIVNGDKLIADPGGELRKVQKFLKIDLLMDRKDFVFNTTKRFYCLKNRPDLDPDIKQEIVCLGPSKGREHPTISERTLRAMQDFYRPYNQELYKIVGTDFGW